MLPVGLEVVGCSVVRGSECQQSAQELVDDLKLPVSPASLDTELTRF